MLKNKNLFLFIGVGFVITVLVWGIVGGCGTSKLHIKASAPAAESEGLMLEEGKAGDVNTNIYTVAAGDTLWGISKKLKVSVQALKSENKLAKDSISIGQRLVVPAGGQSVSDDSSRLLQPINRLRNDKGDEKTTPEASAGKIPGAGQIVYKVKKGDSIWRIAQIHGTTIERILELNGLRKNSKLNPGQEILVPGDTGQPR